LIDFQDIAECKVISIPKIDATNLEGDYEKDYLIQLLLYGHGDKAMG